jgi:hypothetical protein
MVMNPRIEARLAQSCAPAESATASVVAMVIVGLAAAALVVLALLFRRPDLRFQRRPVSMQ